MYGGGCRGLGYRESGFLGWLEVYAVPVWGVSGYEGLGKGSVWVLLGFI